MSRDRRVQKKALTGLDESTPSQARNVQLQRELAGLSPRDQLQRLQPPRPMQPPVQQKSTGAEPSAAAVKAKAADGVSGGGQPLPFLDKIQSAMPGHDLSDVQAHVGGKAGEACSNIGASAYATGNDVAFKKAPDLHTAAHEAAHVVQQRAGVQLSDGVGKAGDAYERQADKVADAVVGETSAHPAIRVGGTHDTSRTVQKCPDSEECDCASETATDSASESVDRIIETIDAKWQEFLQQSFPLADEVPSELISVAIELDERWREWTEQEGTIAILLFQRSAGDLIENLLFGVFEQMMPHEIVDLTASSVYSAIQHVNNNRLVERTEARWRSLVEIKADPEAGTLEQYMVALQGWSSQLAGLRSELQGIGEGAAMSTLRSWHASGDGSSEDLLAAAAENLERFRAGRAEFDQAIQATREAVSVLRRDGMVRFRAVQAAFIAYLAGSSGILTSVHVWPEGGEDDVEFSLTSQVVAVGSWAWGELSQTIRDRLTDPDMTYGGVPSLLEVPISIDLEVHQRGEPSMTPSGRRPTGGTLTRIRQDRNGDRQPPAITGSVTYYLADLIYGYGRSSELPEAAESRYDSAEIAAEATMPWILNRLDWTQLVQS